MRNILKKLGTTFTVILFCLIGIPIFLLFVLFKVICMPYDWLQYRRSLFYKDFGLKFQLFATDSDNYILYNKIKNAELPICYAVCRSPDGDYGPGYFYYGDTAFYEICYEGLQYNHEKDIWCWCDPEEPFSSLESDFAMHIDACNKAIGKDICKKVTILVDEAYLRAEDIQTAKQSPLFLVHDGENTVEVLKAFVEMEQQHEL